MASGLGETLKISSRGSVTSRLAQASASCSRALSGMDGSSRMSWRTSGPFKGSISAAKEK